MCDFVLRMLERVDQLVPDAQVGRRRADAELLADDDVEMLGVQQPGNLVDRIGVQRRDDRFLGNVGEQRDLLAVAVRDRPVGAAQDDVGLDTDFPQFLDRMLCGLGLHLAGRGNVRQQRQVDVADVVAAERDAQLPNGLEERQRFDVADGAADLDDRDLGIAGTGDDPVLDLVGDVRNDLHGAAQVIAAALLADDGLVDLAGGEVVALPHPHVGEALVVAEVQVRLGAVVGDEYFPVLERGHRAGIDVDVRIELEIGDADAAGREDRGERRGGDALPE